MWHVIWERVPQNQADFGFTFPAVVCSKQQLGGSLENGS